MSRHGFAVLSIVGALAVSAPLVSADQASQREAKFKEWDANGDGRLDRSEYKGHPGNFRYLDKDHDGLLSLAEYQDRSVAAEDPVSLKPGGSPSIPVPADDFSAKDHNRDGVVSREEWPDYPEFSKRDVNRDGVVTRDEYFFAKKGTVLDERFDKLDRNRDGAISRNEWRGSSRTFDRADSNRDGALTREEFYR